MKYLTAMPLFRISGLCKLLHAFQSAHVLLGDTHAQRAQQFLATNQRRSANVRAEPPCLAEADVMRGLRPDAEFVEWAHGFPASVGT